MTKIDLSLREKYYNTMPEREIMIQNMIRRLGIIKIDQISAIFDFNEKEKESCYYHLMDLLRRNDRILITQSEEVIDFGNREPDFGTIECIWDLISKRGAVDLNTVERGDAPANLIYLDSDNCLNISTLITKGKLGTVLYLQERYFARHMYKKDQPDEDNIIKHVFVVNDMAIAEQIANDLNLQIPCEICHVDHSRLDKNGMPTVEYYKF